MTRACAALLLCGCVVSGPYRTRVTHERAAARKNLPDELVLPDAPAPASVGAFRVRAWVDEDYRHRPRWRETVEELVGRASRYIAAAFGATLEVDVRAWRRSGDVPIGDMLDELAAADPGDDVDWVIGFVTAPQALSTDLDHIGVARPMGKHFVVRDMNDAGEARAVDQLFPDLPAGERVELYAARKRHKELVVFLHEWAHTLGHPHEGDPTHVMGLGYSPRAAVFSPEGTRLLRLALAVRRGAPPAELRRLLEANPGGWPARERAEVLAALGVPDERWRDELQSALSDGAVTRAEKLLASHPDEALAAKLVRFRRQTGLAQDQGVSGVAPGDEVAVAAAFVAIMQSLADLPEARRLHAAADRRFPHALPLDVALCSIEGSAGNKARARKVCRAALARWDDLPFAHFWAGQVADKEADAIAHHRRVIELDPAQEGSWTVLAVIYDRRHDTRALAELRQRFRAQFGRELP